MHVIKEMKSLVSAAKSYYHNSTSGDHTLARLLETVAKNFKTKRNKQIAKMKELKTSPTLKEFVHFPKLAAELRLRILKFALPGTKIVQV
jgi:hypothetical protein